MKQILPIVIILICAAAFYWHVMPQWAASQVLAAKVAEYETVLATSMELKDKRDEVLTIYNSIPAQDVERLGKIIPKKFDEVVFANNMTAMAARRGMLIKDLRANLTAGGSRDASSLVAQAGYKTITVNMIVEGPLTAFIEFLRDIESSLTLLDVTGLSVRPASAISTQYSLEMHTFALEDSGVRAATPATDSQTIGQDILDLMAKFESTQIDPSIFSSSLLKSLVDFSIPLSPEAYGRPNPFAPIGVER